MGTGPFTKIRRELGLSTGEFAKLLNLAPITVVRIEQGRSRIPLKAFLPIANLGLDFFEVMIEQEYHVGMRKYRVFDDVSRVNQESTLGIFSPKMAKGRPVLGQSDFLRRIK